MRTTARELAPAQPQAASKLRDALGGMDQTDLTNRVQRTADWLRRGINPNSNGTEEGISKGLDQLSQEVHQAQQGLGPGRPSPGQGEQTAALDHVERFRNQIESLTGRGQNPLGRQPGQEQGQGGRSKGSLDSNSLVSSKAKVDSRVSNRGSSQVRMASSFNAKGIRPAAVAQAPRSLRTVAGINVEETRSPRIT